MPNLSIFDVAGPVMVGPSSSHTAGACKIGQYARALFHGTPNKVTFYLHGSFGEVYKGHATDKALLGGVMKFMTSEPKIKHSFDIANDKKLAYKFIKKDLGKKYHPNTVKIVLENTKRKMSIIGSSIGGGMIEIVKINSFDVLIRGRAGKYLSLVVCHDRIPRIIPEMVKKLKKMGLEVAHMEQTNYRDKTLSVLSLEGGRIKLPQVIDLERNTKGVEFVRSLSKLEKQ